MVFPRCLGRDIFPRTQRWVEVAPTPFQPDCGCRRVGEELGNLGLELPLQDEKNARHLAGAASAARHTSLSLRASLSLPVFQPASLVQIRLQEVVGNYRESDVLGYEVGDNFWASLSSMLISRFPDWPDARWVLDPQSRACDISGVLRSFGNGCDAPETLEQCPE